MTTMYSCIQPFLLNGFIFICKTLHHIDITGKYLYKIPILRELTDNTCYFSKYIYCTLMSQRIEPYLDSWSSKCWISLDNSSLTQSHKYHEEYETETISAYLFRFIDHFMTVLYGQHEVEVVVPPKIDEIKMVTMINPIVIIKTSIESNESNEPCYVVAFKDASNAEPEIDNLKKSKASFLTIEYRHPEMEKSIDFSLDKKWMVSGNVLFTPAFVLRMLEYQSTMYYYDDRYIIRIIDKDINICDFGMDRYIELTDTGYVLQSFELSEYNKCMSEIEFETETDSDSDIDTGNEYSEEIYYRRW